MTEVDAATLLAWYGVGMIGGSPAGGILADHIGRKPTLMFSLILSGLAMLGTLYAPPGLALVAAVMAVGFSGEALRPAATASIADILPDHARARGFAVYRVAINLGFGVACLLGGELSKVSFPSIFWVDAGTGFAAAITTFIFVTETRPARLPHHPTTGPDEQGPVGRFAVFCLLTLVAYCTAAQLTTNLPISLMHRGLPESTYLRILSINGLSVVLFQLPVNRVSTRLRITTGLALGALCYGLGYGLGALPASAWSAAATIWVATIGEMIFVPLGATYTARLAPEAQRGRWMGVFSMCYGLARTITPPLGAALMGRLGHQDFWLLSPVVGLVAAIGFLGLGRSEPSHERTDPLMPAPADA